MLSGDAVLASGTGVVGYSNGAGVDDGIEFCLISTYGVATGLAVGLGTLFVFTKVPADAGTFFADLIATLIGVSRPTNRFLVFKIL